MRKGSFTLLVVGVLTASLTGVSAYAAPTPGQPVSPPSSPTPSASPSAGRPETTPSRSVTPAPTVAPTPSTASSAPATPTPATPTPAGAAAAPRVATAIQQRYAELGGAASVLGTPVGTEQAVGAGAYQDYTGGAIFWSPTTGARFSTGPVLERYRALGGPSGQLRFPTSDPFRGGREMTVQVFEGGNIYWRPDVGATHLVGQILAKYGQFRWENGPFDVPTEGESRGADNQSYYNRFRDEATIMWNPATGAHEVHGLIHAKWRQLGAERFGVPATDEFVGNDRGRARLSFFQQAGGGEASVVWTPQTGAHEVHGSIRERWHGLGAEGGVLGAPTSDEFIPARQDARVNRFERGIIVWTPGTGAHPVLGAMAEEYGRRGWEGGDLGAPTSAEWRFADGWAQDFQNGRLLFLDRRGMRTQVRTNAYVRQANAADVQRTFRAGCPVGPDQLRVVEMNHLAYDGRIHRGMMVLRWDAVDRTVNAFTGAAWDSFPIEKMINPDVWGNDPDQMAANNTSGFFCRTVVGNPYSMSPHSYGRAVDVNTVQNPYFDGSRWWPSNGRPWIDRNRRDPGMLFDGGPMTKNLTDNGYFWGGWWASKDYQHFQIN